MVIIKKMVIILCNRILIAAVHRLYSLKIWCCFLTYKLRVYFSCLLCSVEMNCWICKLNHKAVLYKAATNDKVWFNQVWFLFKRLWRKHACMARLLPSFVVFVTNKHSWSLTYNTHCLCDIISFQSSTHSLYA